MGFARIPFVLKASWDFWRSPLQVLKYPLDIFNFDPIPESLVRTQYMFEPKLEKSYSSNAARYALIGAETTPCYGVKKSVVSGSIEREDDSFFIGVVTAGSCTLRTEQHSIKLKTFDKFFCPAGLGSYQIESDNEVQILECFPPATVAGSRSSFD